MKLKLVCRLFVAERLEEEKEWFSSGLKGIPINLNVLLIQSCKNIDNIDVYVQVSLKRSTSEKQKEPQYCTRMACSENWMQLLHKQM